MQPQFDDYQDGAGAELLCPECNSNYLHHGKVEIFERGEDEKQGVHVSVSDGHANMDISMEGNPSARRNGLNIHFRCEGCKAKSVLAISQHKGITYVDFKSLQKVM
nr:hypothetical protein [uncultured Albidiferax sp.]